MMTKITRITALMLALLLILTGCSGSTGENTTTAATTTVLSEDRETLKVYVFNYNGTDTSIGCVRSFARLNEDRIDVQIEEFTDVESMEERLKVELGIGQGPDVILADSNFTLDMMSIAENGAFYDMTDIITADETFNEENYYTNVMKGGQVDGRQYIIPLTFSVLSFCSTEAKLENTGIDWDNAAPAEVYRRTLDYLKAEESCRITGYHWYKQLASALMGTLAIDPADYGETYTLEDEHIRTILELAAECYRQRAEFMKKGLPGWMNEFFPEAGKLPLHLSYSGDSPLTLAHACAGFVRNEEDADFKIYIPPMNEDGDVCALIIKYAVISMNCQNPELAWELICYMMNSSVYAGDYGVSLSRELVRTGGLPKDRGEQVLNAYNHVTDAILIQTAGASLLIDDAMRSIASGEADIDVISGQLSNQLYLYANE